METKKIKVIWNGKTIKEFEDRKQAKQYAKGILLDRYDKIKIV